MLGNLEIKNKSVSVTTYATKEFEGIIGADFLRKKIFVFNPEKKIVIITNKKNVIKKKDFNAYSLNRRWDQKYLLTLRINEDKKEYVLDTGFDGFLQVYQDFNPSEVIIKKNVTVAVIGQNSIKQQKGTFFQLKNFKFDRIKIDTANITQVSYHKDNLIGSHIFNEGITILDFINNKIYFKKNLKIKNIGISIPLQDISFGVFNDRIVVSQVNQTLENINIEPLDILLEINNHIVNKGDHNKTFISENATKKINQFVLERNGKRIEIDLTKKMLGL